MKVIQNSLLLLAFLSFSLSTAFAQKVGHLNSGNLLELLPETKSATKDMETYKKQLDEQLDTKVKAFELKVKDFYNPDIRLAKTPLKLQEEEQALAREEQDLLKERRENEQKLLDKRKVLLKPIFEKVDQAIHDVANELGYQMIFDSGVFNSILYKDDSIDITEIVKAKLGLPKE